MGKFESRLDEEKKQVGILACVMPVYTDRLETMDRRRVGRNCGGLKALPVEYMGELRAGINAEA